MTLHAVEARTQVGHDANQRRQQPRQSRQLPGSVRVISGEAFRRLLGFGKAKFADLVKSGRVRHLLSVNLSTASRPVYVLAKVEAWVSETVASGRPSRQSREAR